MGAVFLSSPHQSSGDIRKPSLPVVPNVASCSPELGFMLDSNNMYIAPLAPSTSQTGHRFCSSGGTGFSIGATDLAYDGNHYGVLIRCDGINEGLFWGRLDPYGAITTPGVFNLGPVPYSNGIASDARPAFMPEVPEPGAPIGYRLGGRTRDALTVAPCDGLSDGRTYQRCIDLYAVDSLSPYREHLVAANLLPPIDYNFAFGTSVVVVPGAGTQQSRTNVLFTTTNAVYCYGAGPICPATVASGKMIQVGFLSIYKISRNAAITGSSAIPGSFWIADGGALFRFGTCFDGPNVCETFFAKPLSQIVNIGRLNCAPGGVHFEPDLRIFTSEAGEADTFTVVLTAAPTADVTMMLSSSNPNAGTVSPASVTFTPANWSTPQTVTVTGVLNPAAAGPQDYVILTGDLTSGDANYNGMVIRDLAATNYKGAGPSLTVHSPLTLQQGSMLTAKVADVSDAEDAAGSLSVSIDSNLEAVDIGPPTNTNGAVTAPVNVTCDVMPSTRTDLSPGLFRAWMINVVDSAGNRRSDQLRVDVGALANPVLSYANRTVNAEAGGLISPATFDGAASSITASSPTFTGTLSVDSSTGVVTVGNAGPAGDHTINLTADHRCNSSITTNTSFTLHVNTPPSLTPGTPTVQQGMPAATATLGTVSDLETGAGALVVTAISVPSGVTVGPITNTNGIITAPLSASCSAVTGPRTLMLRVTDGDGASTDVDVTVDVTANPAPTLGTYPSMTVNAGGGGTAAPTAPPADDQSVVSVSAPGFSGSLSVNAATGVVTIGNAGPAGNYMVTVTVTDNCGATATSSFSLVVNANPTISGNTVNLSQGSSSTVTLATVNDSETPAGSLTVTATSVPAGIILGAITNTNGTITGPVTIDCASATGGRTITLQVTDAEGATATGNATINVTANPPPVLGSYPATTVLPGGNTTVTPSGAPSDNQSVTGVTAMRPALPALLPSTHRPVW